MDTASSEHKTTSAEGNAPQPTSTTPPAPGYWMAPDGSWHPPQPHQGPSRPSANGIATAGLVLGILGLCLFWLTGLGALLGLLATIFGAIGLTTARRQPDRPRYGHAITGLVTGVLAMVLSIGFLIAVVFLAEGAEDTFERVARDLDSDSSFDIDEINSDPSDGSCDADRWMQDPDC